MNKKGILLILSTAVISGFAIFINQFGVKQVSPYIFTGLKNIVVALVLFSFILLIKEWKGFKKLRKKDWLFLLFIGLLGGSIPFLLFFKGLSISGGAEAAFIHKLMFLFVAILAPIFLKEKLRANILIGLIFLFLGAVFLFNIKDKLALNPGVLLILAATLFWSIEQILSKKMVSRISPRIVAFGRMFFGSIFIIIFWLFSGQFQLLAEINISQISWVLISSAILFAYVFTWYSGLKYVPVTFASAVLSLGAPITSLLTLMQGKTLSMGQIWGIGFIFAGVLSFIFFEKIVRKVKCLVLKTH